VEITFLGHAGIFFETRHGSVLCDPFFNPAFFTSWFPFPSNEEVHRAKIAHPTYLYFSHLHDDHFDEQFLREQVWKEAIVLVPDFPINVMERALRKLGFTKFIQTKNSEAIEVNRLRFMIMAMTAPNDGAIGDSGLMLDDGETRIFDQNDSRPIDLDRLTSFGPFDAHFVQYSGATWFPLAYQFPEKMLHVLGRKKRENQLARALRYVQEIGATFVIPSAGPPCFLDDDLFQFNDFDRDPTNTFPDQTVFLEYMQAHGMNNGQLMIPGSIATLSKDTFLVEHPLPAEQIQSIFKEKRAYLEAYKARQQPLINAQKAGWPRGQVDILSSLQEWFESLLAQANVTCVGVNGRIA
jgi:UDP-MurNAc hydroxylase